MRTIDYLRDRDFVDTRASSLAYALQSVFNAVAALDRPHLNRLSVHFPQLIEAARAYAEIEGGLNRFDDVN